MKQHRSGSAFRVCVVLGLLSFGAGCTRGQPPTAPGQGGWLAGTVDERFDTVARQLRGFDMAMVETGYRYSELHWAAQDENWEYARYQLEKIRTAVENGLERRPLRAASAETFLTLVLPAVEAAIDRRDAALLQERLDTLRSTCNSCHEAEDVAFIHVGVPEVRPFTATR